MKKFDLNIEKVLKNWEVFHAVREIISNATDEQILSKTKEIEIKKDEKGRFVIRDFGRGIRYKHLTQNENLEKKLKKNEIIGHFGVGLKDALATFHRNNIKIKFYSKHDDISIEQSSKHNFNDISTIHAIISPPSFPNMEGSKVILSGCTDSDIENAKQLFLKFANEKILEKTEYGEVLEKNQIAKIYINGVKVSEEKKFLFSYNITSLTSKMERAFNREKRNFGKEAYGGNVQKILLHCKNQDLLDLLVDDFIKRDEGNSHDEIKYTKIAIPICKIVDKLKKYIFFTKKRLENNASVVAEIKNRNLKTLTLPENLYNNNELKSIKNLESFVDEMHKNFDFKFIDYSELTDSEKEIYNKKNEILALIGGKPQKVKEILISETMRKELSTNFEVVGLWIPEKKRIIIKRNQLKKLEYFSATLIHEIIHAVTELDDVTREFEDKLTELIGLISAKHIKNKK